MEDAKERLFKAAVAGDTEVLKQLADERPADVIFSIRNDQGELASHVALQHGRHEFAMKMCSYYPAALWELNGKGDGLLHMVAKLGHHQIFLYGARILFRHFRSYDVEHDERRRDAMKLTNSAVNREGKSLLYVAAENGYFLLDAAKLLLKNEAYCADMDRAFMGPDGSTALQFATRNMNYDMVRIFLQHGVPDSIITRQEVETGYTPLHIAVSLNEPRLAELFLTTLPSSANILDRDGFTPLHLAVRLNMTEILELFLRHCPDCFNNKTLTDNGQNALHIAVERNIEGVISGIVKDKRLSELMINQQDENGNTPLHIAVLLNKPRLAEMFLTTPPSSANILDRDGFSPLHLAVRINQTEMFELFLRHCPDCCMTRTDKGQNALHIAVERNIEGFISVVVKDKRLSELMINQQDEDGNTPLHLAAYRDDKKKQDTLLGCQAKVKPLKNKAGLTFQDVAKRKEKRFVDAMKEFQSSLLVMTTLIITVTFTASFTLPGGYNGNQPNQGMATLMGLTGFDVFLVTNTLSMSSSIIATASLILFPVVAMEKQFRTMKVAVGAIVVSILLMLMAVTAGVWVVIGSQRKWLAIFIAFITSSTPLCLVILVKTVMPASEFLSIWRIFL